MIHIMRLDPEPFGNIRRGEKHEELRLNDEKRQKIQVGDQIEFRKRPELTEAIMVEVTSLTHYKNFSDLFDAVHTRYLQWTKELFLERMRTRYSQEDEEKYGTLAIGFTIT